MFQRNELISYALDFVSYLVSKIKKGKINQIILHGSVARGDFDSQSDIDLFIDTSESEKKINKIVDMFYNTEKFKKWNLKGINNSISCIVGELNSKEWKDLKRSIINTGFVLYGKYKAETEKINYYTLISFGNIKPDKKRISVYRKLFGFKQNKKHYPGMVEKMNAIKIGKGVLLVPIENANEFKKYFQKKKVPIKLYDLWSDVKIN